MEFKYRVSIIIPVYNVEKYIGECLDSLVEQTIEKSEIEVLLINDGSPDNSEEICLEYSKKHSFISYIKKENGGVSSARNLGIKTAQGRYILFLDSDDKLTPNSVKAIADYFDSVYDEVDLVTYFMQPYKGSQLLAVHSRYSSTLLQTGVYDLEQHPYTIQTTMNICVKNLGEDNHYFNEKMSWQEDQEYINRVIMDKLKIGYCDKACYMYNRSNEGSAVSTSFYSYNIFESSMKYFEDLFNRYPEKVPRYYQALYFHDLRWKLTSKILYPFHYDEQHFEEALNRIKRLLSRVDTDIITRNPSITKKYIHYWLGMKPNIHPTVFPTNSRIDIIADGRTIEHSGRPHVNIAKIELTDNNTFRIRGVLDISANNYLNSPPKLLIVENETIKKRISLFDSKYSYSTSNVIISKSYGFDIEIDPKEVTEFSMLVKVDAYIYNARLGFLYHAVFNRKKKTFKFARGNYIFSLENHTIKISYATRDEIYQFEKEQIDNYCKSPIVSSIKNQAVDYRYEHRVWLYSDFSTVEKDNGYYQFISDFNRDDGIERYYVYTRPLEEIKDLFAPEHSNYLVEFGSQQHMVLYLASELIFSSFFGRVSISPFVTAGEESNYNDIEHFRVIYMQHGILHADFLTKYSAESCECDKVVVSSNFELENLTQKYLYRECDLIKSGMPRYEFINRKSKAKNRILFAPSWRSYIAKNTATEGYKINTKQFKSSDYYINFSQFFNNKKLAEMLEKNDLHLDVKMHPIINDVVSSLFSVKSKRIHFVNTDVNLEDYSAFITDFSSFVFDYAYLNRPILYFVPDYPQFKSGMNLYRKLDLPFEKAFGPFTTDPENAFLQLEKIVNNNFKPEDIYAERMDKFYLPMGRCRQDIYNYVTSVMLPSKSNA